MRSAYGEYSSRVLATSLSWVYLNLEHLPGPNLADCSVQSKRAGILTEVVSSRSQAKASKPVGPMNEVPFGMHGGKRT